MAVSDSAEVPEQLRVARRTLEEVAGVTIVTDWAPDPMRGWRLELDLRPGDLGTVFEVPRTTRWFVCAPSHYPKGQIDVLPAVKGGLSGIFPHQRPFMADLNAPYRGAKICVATDSEGNLRAAADAEPRGPADRLAWQIRRALGWIESASKALLLSPGDAFELPVYDGLSPELFVFREGPDDLRRWDSVESSVGIADLRLLRTTGGRIWAVTAFRSLDSRLIFKPEWGGRIGSSDSEHRIAVWIRASSLPVRLPYAAPTTWGELSETYSQQGGSLIDFLRQGLAGLYDRERHPLLIGFGVPELVGGPLFQQHWLAIDLPVLDRNFPHGFRPNELGFWMANSRTTFRPDAQVNWARTQNWHPEQLATRGRLSTELTQARALLVGGGALGSAVAELLVRAGVAQLTIVDDDVLVAGNLVRHTLTMDNLGQSKAEALATRLSAASPNANVVGRTAAAEALLDGVFIKDFDLVIDTTGDHDILDLLAGRQAPQSTAYASFAITLHARRLIAYLARGTAFPVDAFDAAYEPLRRAQLAGDETLPMEGVGCWQPVFPARADQIWLMAAAAIGLLNDLWPLDEDSASMQVFERLADEDGRFAGVARADV